MCICRLQLPKECIFVYGITIEVFNVRTVQSELLTFTFSNMSYTHTHVRSRCAVNATAANGNKM